MTIKKKISGIISSAVHDEIDLKDSTTISMRVPNSFLESINKEVRVRIGMNRTSWILQACEEKLRRKNE